MTTSKNDLPQEEMFKETARELGVDLDEDKLKEALRKIAKPKGDDEPTSAE